jgi:radical SAM superfamily enzyme YgiQ (UPF0313 family)
MKRVLLTNPYGPYDLEWGQNQYDILESRLQRGQEPFTLKSDLPCSALYLIAENIDARTTVLEFPNIEDFQAELQEGYDYLGIQVIAVSIGKVAHMIRVAREIAPQTKIIIGGYGVLNLYDPPPGETSGSAEYILKEVDYICSEEGVRFMRRLLGDDPIDRPITQKYLPFNRIYFPGAEGVIQRSTMTAMVLVALGCPNGCEFCCTSAMFKKQKIYIATPEETFETLKHYCLRNGGRPTSLGLMDENFLMNTDYVRRLGKLIQEDTDYGLRKLSYFCFGDLRSLELYSMEELLELGVDIVWVGIESSIEDVVTSEHRIEKRSCSDIRGIIQAMEQCGIGITASMVLGWDFHTPENIEQDIDFFVNLAPSAYQITFLTACAGTKLYSRMKEANRLNPRLTYHDMQQCNDGTFIPKHFRIGELKHYFDLAHKKLYQNNGPSIFRTLQLNLNGYETCIKSRRPLLRDHKAPFFADRCRKSYPLLQACDKFAPTGKVREKVKETGEKYRSLFGDPTDEMKLYSKIFVDLVAQRVENLKEPPTNEPFDPPVRRMYYDPTAGPVPVFKEGRGPGESIPYQVYDDPEPVSLAC